MQSPGLNQIIQWTSTIEVPALDTRNRIIMLSEGYAPIVDAYMKLSSLSNRHDHNHLYEYLYNLQIGFLPMIHNDEQLVRLPEILPDWFTPSEQTIYPDITGHVGFVECYSNAANYMCSHLPQLRSVCEAYPKPTKHIPPAMVSYGFDLSIMYQKPEDKPSFATHDIEEGYFYVANSVLCIDNTELYVNKLGKLIEQVSFPKAPNRFRRLNIWRYTLPTTAE